MSATPPDPRKRREGIPDDFERLMASGSTRKSMLWAQRSSRAPGIADTSSAPIYLRYEQVKKPQHLPRLLAHWIVIVACSAALIAAVLGVVVGIINILGFISAVLSIAVVPSLTVRRGRKGPS